MIKANHNFSDIFNFGQYMTKLENPVTVGMGFSITSILCLISLLLIAGCLMLKYGRRSDEEIKEDPSFIPNKKHAYTTCFIILNIILMIFVEIFLITSLGFIISIFSQVIFNQVVYFENNCVKNKDSFEKKYSYCWDVGSSINIYIFFTVLNFIIDIASLVFVKLADNYNVWSFLFNKITCGKYEYTAVDYKGFIASQEKEDENENEKSKNIIEGLINDDNEISNNSIGGPINDAKE